MVDLLVLEVEGEVGVTGIIESLTEVEKTLSEEFNWQLLLFLLITHY
jgi:hypothetical protein